MKALVYKNLSDAFDIVDIPVGKPVNHIIEIDREYTIVIVNGKTKPADYIVQENDVIIICTVPAAFSTAALITAIVVGVIAIGAGVYAGVKAYQAREAAKRAEEEIEKMKNRSKDGVVNLPYIKGASNTVATGKTEPYIIGEHLFTPYILNSGGKYRGYSVIDGENGKINIMSLFSRAVLINRFYAALQATMLRSKRGAATYRKRVYINLTWAYFMTRDRSSKLRKMESLSILPNLIKKLYSKR